MHTSSKSPSSDRSGRYRLRKKPLRKSATVRSSVLASVLIQLLASLCLSLAVAIVYALGGEWHWTHIVSVWLGGGIAAAVTMFGAWRALWRRPKETGATQLLVQLYSAEFGKLLVAGLLLGLAFKQLTQLHGGLLLAGFALAYLAGAVGLAVKGIAEPQGE